MDVDALGAFCALAGDGMGPAMVMRVWLEVGVGVGG